MLGSLQLSSCSDWLMADQPSGNLNSRPDAAAAQCQFCAAACHCFISAAHTDLIEGPVSKGP